MRVKLTTKTEVDLDIELAAKWFAGLDDDSQAKFFVAVCAAAKDWRDEKTGEPVGGFRMDHQWWLVGSHLKNCECSTDDAREMIKTMYDGLQNGTH